MSAMRRKRHRPMRMLGLSAAILACSLVALPINRAIAYDGNSANLGSIDDYMQQGQRRNRGYGRRGYGGGQGYSSSRGSRSQMNPALMSAMMLALWALERRQERHQRHDGRYAMRNHRGFRHSRSLRGGAGNPMPSTLGYGF